MLVSLFQVSSIPVSPPRKWNRVSQCSMISAGRFGSVTKFSFTSRNRFFLTYHKISSTECLQKISWRNAHEFDDLELVNTNRKKLSVAPNIRVCPQIRWWRLRILWKVQECAVRVGLGLYGQATNIIVVSLAFCVDSLLGDAAPRDKN